jgi:uncharacterized membrane protein YqjE
MAAQGMPGADSHVNGTASPRPADAAAAAGAAGAAAAAPQPSWLASLQGLLQELPGLVSDRIELLSLELQRAAQVLAQIVALIVAAAILAVTAWLALWGGVVMALIAAGLHWALASLLVLVLNLGASWWAVARIRALAPLLKLPATRRQLTLRQLSPTGPTPSDHEHSTPTTATPGAR